MAGPASLSRQELVDRLVTAIEEEDVLFTVHWLQEMDRRGLISSREGDPKAEGLNPEHSWKKRSALVTAVSGPATPFRQFILTLLLLHIRDMISCAALSAAIALRATWAISVLNNWQSPAVQETAIVRTPRELLAMHLAEVAEWIDANLPPHPLPDSLTGCGALLDPPRPSSTHRSSLPQSASNETEALPALPPPSVVAATTSLAACQVRLCEIRGSISVDRLCNLLPPIEGLSASTAVGKNAALLTFESPETARKALLPLQGSEYFRAAVLESVFQTAAQPDPSRPPARPGPSQPATVLTALPPSAVQADSAEVSTSQNPRAGAAQPRATPLPPAGWSSPAPNPTEAIKVHISNLPTDTALDDVEGLLAITGVAYWDLGLAQRSNPESAYLKVATKEDYTVVSTTLNGSLFRRRQLLVERQILPFSPAHPIVVVRNLPAQWGVPVIRNLARSTRLGAYGEAMQPLADGTGIERFLVGSPASAQEAVDMLNGAAVDGVTMIAEWTNGDGTTATPCAPQAASRTADRPGASTAAAATTSAVQPALIAVSVQTSSLSSPDRRATSSEASTNVFAMPTSATSAVVGTALQHPSHQRLHLPPSPLSTPALETPSQLEPFALPASSFSTQPAPKPFVANITPPVSPAFVNIDLLSTTSDLWGQELQGRRKAGLDGDGGEQRAAKRRK
ncbi:hypothetical protein JCM10295v2_004467 [Rhodotorula toruloides]